MALRERKDCTDEGLVPRADAIQSSLRPSSTHRRMSSMNFLRETLWFIPTCAPYFWLRTQENPPHLRCEAGKGASARRPIFRELRPNGILPSSPCPAQEVTQYALVIATIVRRCDHVASKGHRGPPALLHGDVEGYRGTMERLGRALCVGPMYWTSTFGTEPPRICSPALCSSRKVQPSCTPAPTVTPAARGECPTPWIPASIRHRSPNSLPQSPRYS